MDPREVNTLSDYVEYCLNCELLPFQKQLIDKFDKYECYTYLPVVFKPCNYFRDYQWFYALKAIFQPISSNYNE